MSLQGTLKTLGITEVLEFLSSRAASGRLDVTTEMGTATFALVDGSVSSAEYSFIRESGVDAAEATYYVVSELDGTFYFDDDQVPEPDDESEDVGSVLFRTAEIAERWADVEEVIPSPNHLLSRNNQLDGSVTIQPEWWKALEMIGDGSTSLQLASALDLSALDASLTALAMANAGLLTVSEVDPLDIALSSDLEVEPAATSDPAAMISEAVDALDDLAHVSPALETDDQFPVESFAAPAVDEPSPPPYEAPAPTFEPVDMLEMVDVEPPAPHVETPATTMSFSSPVVEEPAPEPVLEPVVEEDEFAGASGMDDLSELEYMLEPDGFSPAAAEAPPVPQEIDDDGWSSAHVGAATELRPLEAPPVPAEPIHVAQSEPVVEAPSPFEVIPAPEHPSPFDEVPMPSSEISESMELADLPAPPPPLEEPVDVPQAPVPEAGGFESVADTAATPSATAMAGEVLDDLASLSEELAQQSGSEEGDWELDGTFVPEENPAPQSPEGDPFGDLGELLKDDEERSSVLKFLRRD